MTRGQRSNESWLWRRIVNFSLHCWRRFTRTQQTESVIFRSLTYSKDLYHVCLFVDGAEDQEVLGWIGFGHRRSRWLLLDLRPSDTWSPVLIHQSTSLHLLPSELNLKMDEFFKHEYIKLPSAASRRKKEVAPLHQCGSFSKQCVLFRSP